MSKTNTIPDGWKETTLGEFVTLQRGFDLPTSKRKQGNYPLLAANGQDGTHNEYKVKGPGVTTGRSGTLGEVYYVKENFWPLNTTLWVKDFKNNDTKFAYYFLKTIPFERYNAGSGVPTLNRNHIHPLPVQIPQIAEQKAIAAVLSSLDDKIELLREQNKTLESVAQAIFKEWFVKFNFPNENGKPYKDNGGKMIESKLGEIPTGWRVGKVSDIADIFDSERVPLSDREREKRRGHYPYYGATRIMDYIDDFIFDGIYLLLAEDGSVIDENGFSILQYVWGKFWVNNHAHVLRGKNGISTEILYLVFRRKKISEIVTGAVQLKINQHNLLNLGLVIPVTNILEKFDFIIQPIFQKVRDNYYQIQSLSNFRDILLPTLMVGRLRVKTV